jgi:hypothetical protein
MSSRPCRYLTQPVTEAAADPIVLESVLQPGRRAGCTMKDEGSD